MGEPREGEWQRLFANSWRPKTWSWGWFRGAWLSGGSRLLLVWRASSKKSWQLNWRGSAWGTEPKYRTGSCFVLHGPESRRSDPFCLCVFKFCSNVFYPTGARQSCWGAGNWFLRLCELDDKLTSCLSLQEHDLSSTHCDARFIYHSCNINHTC